MLRLAGIYPITQPKLAQSLRDTKMAALETGQPDVIATASIGCLVHLYSAGKTPVRHWIEPVEERMAVARTVDRLAAGGSARSAIRPGRTLHAQTRIMSPAWPVSGRALRVLQETGRTSAPPGRQDARNTEQ